MLNIRTQANAVLNSVPGRFMALRQVRVC